MDEVRSFLAESPNGSPSESYTNEEEGSVSSLLDNDGNFDSSRLDSSISSEDLKEALFQSQRRRMAKTMQQLAEGQRMFENSALNVSFNTSLIFFFLLIQI
jgi:hypothetical protein